MTLVERIERNVLKWFGHVVRMGEERLVKRVHRVNVEGNRGRVRSQKRWRDEVKDLLLGRGLSEREGMMLARDRDAWGRMVYRSEEIKGMSLLTTASVRGIHHFQVLGTGSGEKK